MSGNESEEVPLEIEKYIAAVETDQSKMSENESEVPSEIEKYIEAVETTAPQSVCLLRMNKSGQLTGKYFSEAPFLVSTTYGKIWDHSYITSALVGGEGGQKMPIFAYS